MNQYVSAYRNPENIHREEVMQDFLEYYKDSISEYGATKPQQRVINQKIAKMENYIKDFLDYDELKVEAGEREMLETWKESVNSNPIFILP